MGWSKSLSNDVAADGVTVNMLLPGRIHTERVDELDAAAAKRTGKTLEEARDASRATIPAGRYGTVEEFAAVAAFLASEPASYVTGGLIRCDGGADQVGLRGPNVRSRHPGGTVVTAGRHASGPTSASPDGQHRGAGRGAGGAGRDRRHRQAGAARRDRGALPHRAGKRDRRHDRRRLPQRLDRAAFGGNSCFVPFAAQHRGMGVTETLDLYDSRAEGASVIDYGYHLIVADPTEKVLTEELPAAFERGVTSFKVFMTYDLMKIDDRQFLDILAVARGAWRA